MNGISHKQAVKWIHLRLDEMLKADQVVLLDEHLEACESCRIYSQEIGTLPDYLNSRFKERWDTKTKLSSHVAQRVNAQARNIPMAQRFSSGLKLLTAVATLALFAFVLNFVISRWQGISIATAENTTATPLPLGGNPTTGLLAFTSDTDGNSEIYVINPDGSGLTNLTNNSAYDALAFWSPDGRKIAFTSDRDGSNQIYLMDADGSNVTRLTMMDADYGLDSNGFSPWSPDGTRLIVIKAAAEGGSKIYVLDVAEKTTTELTNDAGQYLMTSWSPDGTHIAYIILETVGDRDAARIHVVDVGGGSDTNITNLLPEDEDLYSWNYTWTREGNISFIAARVAWENNNGKFAYYEATIDGATLVEIAKTSTPLEDHWNGTTFVRGYGDTLTWLRSDGTYSEFKPYANCAMSNETQSGSFFYSRRSPTGYQLFVAGCPNGDLWLYWSNPQGTTIKPLFESPIVTNEGGLSEIQWSPDGGYAAITIASSGSISLYIVNMREAVEAAPVIPDSSVLGRDDTFYNISWQPIPRMEVVEEKPLTTEGLLAFTSMQDGNQEIYTIHADGSAMTNLTNDPATDANPYWSPDGKRIAFQSDRTGVWQIYVMEADGSNLVQLTKDNASHTLPLTMDFKAEPWSPDGTTLLVLKQESGEDQLSLNSISPDGTKETQLVTGRIAQFGISWSPDGNYIGYVQNEAQSDNPNDFGGKLYVVRSDASNAQDITEVFEPDEHLLASLYSWSADGQSISLVSYWRQQHIDETKVYEVRLNDHSVIDKYSTASILNDWPDEMNHAVMAESSVLSNWVRPDGTSRALDPSEHCKPTELGGAYINRSALGNWTIIGHCSHGDHWLYWENVDGTTIKQLIDSPLSAKEVNFITFAWSPDDRYIAFNLPSPDKTVMYILDVNAALNDPSVQARQVKIADTEFYTAPAWQPIPKSEVVEEKPTPEPTPVTTAEAFPNIGTNISNGEWIAFVGGRSVPDPANSLYMTTEQDVFLIHPDGSGLVNITNFPDFYVWPEWSPNGNDLLFLRMRNSGTMDILRKNGSNGFDVLASTSMSFDASFNYSWSPNSEQIAFVDKSAGNLDIYTMYADGRNDPQVTQLTDDPADDFGFVWSPDGDRIAFQRLDGDKLSIHVMNQDGSNPHELARGMGRVRLYWSHDGKVLYASSGSQVTEQSYWLACEGCSHNPAIYRIDLSGSSVEQIYAEPEYSQVGFHLYDTPQNTLYFMRVEPQPFLEFWGTWFRFDGTSIQQIDPLDPHQTCKTTEGNILSEDISPNPRFSIITNYCAGGFDLYLADREATELELLHLLRLPLDTWGQGGDFATLPITWSPDGRWIAYDNGNGGMLLLDLEKVMQDPDTQPVPLIQPILFEGQPGQMFQSPESIFVIDLVWQPKP